MFYSFSQSNPIRIASCFVSFVCLRFTLFVFLIPSEPRTARSMFAYVRYEQDGQRAIVPASLIKEFSPKTPGDFDKLFRVQAYWRGEDGEDEGYYPAFVNEMAGK